jgi:formamidopyrimidine-DNA glycosylase
MPELPEVETTCRGLAPWLIGARIKSVHVRERRMRWPLAPSFEADLTGQKIQSVSRRAKYVLIEMADRTLMIHLGMSGSLRVADPLVAPKRHDHVELVLSSGQCIRFNDPRRFGSLHVVHGEVSQHPLLNKLGPEPLSEGFAASLLHARTRRRHVAIKIFIMNSAIVVGVGNIYASEALFKAGIHPSKTAGKLTRAECTRLVSAIKKVLSAAITAGGTTLRDYVNSDGHPGYFQQKLFVYGRSDEPCRRCQTLIRHRVQGQRATFWCPTCQPRTKSSIGTRPASVN